MLGLFFLCSTTTPAIAEKGKDAYKLVWSADFQRKKTVQGADWDYETGFVRNEELQWYQPQNASIQNGRLVIEAKRERVENPSYDPDSKNWKTSRQFAEYSSACVTTKGRHQWLYGRFEVRARIKAAPGLWPAIWFLGLGKPWPHAGEIDVLEYYHDTILANTCWGDGTWNTARTPYPDITHGDPSWSDKFHTWRMDWDPNWIKIYLDGRLLNQTDLSKTIDPDGSNPFHGPQYLLLNLAIGSTGGDPSKTAFPSQYEIESVRVYQRKQDSDPNRAN